MREMIARERVEVPQSDVRDPDGNLIELVYHALGLVDADGNKVEVPTHPGGICWRQAPEVEAAVGIHSAS